MTGYVAVLRYYQQRPDTHRNLSMLFLARSPITKAVQTLMCFSPRFEPIHYCRDTKHNLALVSKRETNVFVYDNVTKALN